MSTSDSFQNSSGDLVDASGDSPSDCVDNSQPVVLLAQILCPQSYYGANLPQTLPNDCRSECPPGLEYLTQIDQILVHQKIEVFEILTGIEMQNRYHIKNILGQKIFDANEDSDCCDRYLCGPLRPFNMKITNLQEQEVINLYRPLQCAGCCFPCCLQTMEVTASGIVCGSIKEVWTFLKLKLKICDASGETVFWIKGPGCRFNCCSDTEYKVLSKDGKIKIGSITKQWSGLARELYTDADHFSISFPMDLDVKMKAVLLGACFLIDYMLYEDSK